MIKQRKERYMKEKSDKVEKVVVSFKIDKTNKSVMPVIRLFLYAIIYVLPIYNITIHLIIQYYGIQNIH